VSGLIVSCSIISNCCMIYRGRFRDFSSRFDRLHSNSNMHSDAYTAISREIWKITAEDSCKPCSGLLFTRKT
jgi:hypothetical protein